MQHPAPDSGLLPTAACGGSRWQQVAGSGAAGHLIYAVTPDHTHHVMYTKKHLNRMSGMGLVKENSCMAP